MYTGLPTIIVFYDDKGKIVCQSYSDSFRLRDAEAEVKLYRPRGAVRVVFDIALPSENNH